MIQAWMTLRVVKKWREAADIFSFELAAPEGQTLPPFTAGAHVDIEVQPGLVRQYSLCNAPGARDRYQIGVLRETESRGGSAAMIDRIEEGQDIRVSEPRNHFELEPSARKSVLIAGGIGVTPILCMAERLAHAGEPFEMHYAVRSADRAAFKQRIAAAHLTDKVQLHVDDGPAEQRLDLDAILSDPPPGAHLYVCGPGGLIEATLATAKAKGWPDSRVHREYFAPMAQAEAAEPGQFQVKLASSGQTFTVPADKTIVQVLADGGVDVPVSCEQGVCGTCVTRVLEGEPDHRDFFLTADEQARNDQMTVCCSRAKTALLVLDL
jgi:vanillate O-demethylase ferredoxin subunit